MTGVTGPRSPHPVWASLSAALGVPISSSILTRLGLPRWLVWAEDILRAVTALFLALAVTQEGDTDAEARSRDWVVRDQSFTLAWGLPGLALAGSLFVESPARAWIWVPSLLWMGTACMANARRCGRTHCYFTAPLFFIMACVALLDGLGLLALGPRAWTLLGLGLVIGTAGLWWGTERLWGRFLRFDSQRQEIKRKSAVTPPYDPVERLPRLCP